MNYLFRVFLTLILCSFSLSSTAAVTSSLSNNKIGSGETVRLILKYDGRTDNQPDLQPLNKDFEVLGRSSGTNLQIINGRVTSQSQFSVLLMPKHNGKIQVPSLLWDGEMSTPLELTVGGNGSSGQSGSSTATDTSHIFFTTTLDQKQPYVQAAVVVLVRLYTDQPLYQATLDFPASSDVLVRQIGQDKELNETRNGRNYQIIERKYLLFPQRSGKISLKGPVLDAEVPDTTSYNPFGNDPFFGNLLQRMPLSGMMNVKRPIRVKSKTINLEVQPRPALAMGKKWLPASNLKLEESWQPDVTTVRVGEPFTRHLHIEAKGLSGAQLPDLGTLASVPGSIKTYPDQPEIKDTTQGSTLLGSQDIDVTLIATLPGQYELPPIHLSWWDTLKDKPRVTTLPARQLKVLPAVVRKGGTITPDTKVNPSDSGSGNTGINGEHAIFPKIITSTLSGTPWLWVSIALIVLWLFTVFVWWYTRKAAPAKLVEKVIDKNLPVDVNGTKSFKAFKLACQSNDPNLARLQLIAWAKTAWPDHPPLGINELAQRIGDEKLTPLLRELDRACFQGDEWNGEALGKTLSTPPKLAVTSKKIPDLPELYT